LKGAFSPRVHNGEYWLTIGGSDPSAWILAIQPVTVGDPGFETCGASCQAKCSGGECSISCPDGMAAVCYCWGATPVCKCVKISDLPRHENG
jgi:hypothetical protein